MAIYFSMFRREISGMKNVKILNKNLIKDKRWISNFDNTFNQIIFAEAFKNSRAYFQSKPLSINLSDTRDWKSMYCFLEIIRYPEILDYYRKKGLGFLDTFIARIIHLEILLIIFLKFLLIEKIILVGNM